MSPAPEKKEQKIYFSKNAKLRLASFQREKRYPDGSIMTPDVPLCFEENFFITDVPAEQSFIEKHKAFRDGEVKIVDEVFLKNHRAANKLNIQSVTSKAVPETEETF